MPVEPPCPDVPDRRDRQAEVGPLRLSAAAGAAALALLSIGNVVMVAGLLAVALAEEAGAVAALLACAAALVRWGTPSLAAVAGAQAVLGPAIVVGPVAAALSAWLAAAALVLVARTREMAVATGIVAGALLAGPDLPHSIVVRIVGTVATVVVAVAATRLPRHAVTAGAVAGGIALALAAAA